MQILEDVSEGLHRGGVKFVITSHSLPESADSRFEFIQSNSEPCLTV